jgi:ubiquinone/menaquinone biosynthesis C-methylase UbiE
MFSLGANKGLARYANEVIRAEAGMKVLDVGCGPADILAYLPAVDYTGIDLNVKHIEFAQCRYADRGRFIIGNASDDLNQQEGAFDLVIVSGLLHHLTDSECLVLFASLRRLLKPGGRIVTIDNVWLPQQRFVARTLIGMDSGLNVRTPDGYLRLLDNSAFEVESRIYHDLSRVPYDHFCMTARKLRL